jgi:hypothetical protein
MKTFVKTLTCALAVSVAFLACSSEDYEGNVFLSNNSSYKEQKAAGDNYSCPLLPYPYDPSACRGHVTEFPDGRMCQSPIDPSYCREHWQGVVKYSDGYIDCQVPVESQAFKRDAPVSYIFSEAEMDSLQKFHDAMLKKEEEEAKLDAERQIEAQRMYRDSTREATVTFSESQTFIQLSPIFVYVDLELAHMKDSKTNDTLYIEAVPSKKGYGQSGGMPGTGCPISLDITLNQVDEDIAVIVFEKYQVFQVKR